MNIQEKLNKIIPPNDVQHRYDFSNRDLIDQLDSGERETIKNGLIAKLRSDPGDILIIETLSYMRTIEAIPVMEESLKISDNKMQKVIIASSIFKINKDPKMLDIAINTFNLIKDDLHAVAFLFSYLAAFANPKTDIILKRYINHHDFTVAYHAKLALGMIDLFGNQI